MTSGWPTRLLLLEAPTRAALQQRLAELHRRLPDPAALAAQLPLRPTPGSCRAALVVADQAALGQRLEQALQLLASARPLRVHLPGMHLADPPLAPPARLAVVFPGDGSPYLGMTKDLAAAFPEVRQWYSRADEVAIEFGRPTTTSVVFPGELRGARERQRAEHRLRRLENSGAAVLACNQGLYELLLTFGVRPHALIGHSLGDWSALGASGITKVETFLRSAEQALLLPGHVTNAGARMGFAIATREEVAEAIAEVGGEVYIAMHNSPRRVVLAGAKEPVRRTMTLLAQRGVPTYRLPFVRAAHTPLSEAICAPLREAFATWGGALPDVEIWSCTTAQRYPRDLAEIRRLAVANIVQPVEFAATIERAYASGLRLFIECGAGGQLCDCISDLLGTQPHVAVPLDQRQQHGVTLLQNALAALATEGLAVDLTRFQERLTASAAIHTPARSDAATAAVQRFLDDSAALFAQHQATVQQAVAAGQRATSQFLTAQHALATAWLGQREAAAGASGESRLSGFVDEVCERGPDLVRVRCRLDAARQPYLRDHCLGGFAPPVDGALGPLPVVPLTVSIELMAEAAALLFAGQQLVAVTEVVARRPVAAEEFDEVEMVAERTTATTAQVRLCGLLDVPVVLAEGSFEFGQRATPPADPGWRPSDARPPQLTAPELYQQRIMFHGPCFQGVCGLEAVSAAGIVGRLRSLPREMLLGRPLETVLDPALLDAMGQLFGYWPYEQLAENLVVFPTHLGRLEVYRVPQPGDEVEAQVQVTDLSLKRLTGDISLVRDGQVWLRASGWRFWRFNWPLATVRATRHPERAWSSVTLREACGIDLPGAVLWQPKPLELLAFLIRATFSAREHDRYLALPEANRRREHYFLGRVCAKEAIRRWAGDLDLPPAALTIADQESGPPLVEGPGVALLPERPRVSIAHSGGCIAAVASTVPVGLDVERIVARDESFLDLSFSAAERARLGDPTQVTLAWCAKEAAAKAVGSGLTDPRAWQVGPLGETTMVVSPDGQTWAVRLATAQGYALAVAGGGVVG
ncbi:MAG: polyketide synthase dehydratase domain-containing protein [Fimbriimonadaceae bacterium]|nr:polyketide synthase dehydratase domain-containing protein [Fimbriimonadaceae bacterium]